MQIPLQGAEDSHIREVTYCVFASKYARECEANTFRSSSYLRKLEADSKQLQNLTQNPTPQSFGQDTPSIDRDDDPVDSTNISSDESNMLNPLFDGQPENVVNERCSESGYIGEASCTAFSNRLLQCLDPDYTPSTAGFPNYCRINTSNSLAPLQEQDISGFPERMHARLLLNVARRFIGNYHPLFLKVTFMKELDAVYRQEFSPSTMWLCKFYTLMCLGEIYTNRRGIDNSNRVPGTEYYAKAVGMLPDFYEEPSLTQVEVLTLLVGSLLAGICRLTNNVTRHGRRIYSAGCAQHTAIAEQP